MKATKCAERLGLLCILLLPIAVQAQDAGVPSLPSKIETPVPHITLGKTVVGTPPLGPEVLRRTIRGAQTQLRRCYEAALRHSPTLSPKLSVQFTIGVDGAVSSTKVKHDGKTDTPLAKCLAAHLKQLAFPKPRGGGVLTVRYPLTEQVWP